MLEMREQLRLTTLTGTTTSLFTIGVSNAVFNDENDEFGRMSGYVSWEPWLPVA